jgi:hypothetical protein
MGWIKNIQIKRWSLMFRKSNSEKTYDFNAINKLNWLFLSDVLAHALLTVKQGF